ncbi:sterol-binding protein [Nakaseomyces bracarensis]|uniref:sterol-binding protein n=1 Tax=Nakaseomyces bracarensis TaxID=273131 RepID=UPI003871EEFE
MKISTALYASLAVTTIASPAIIKSPKDVVTVQAVVHVENGATKTSYTTLNPQKTASASVDSRSKQELLAALVALANKNDKSDNKQSNTDVQAPKLSDWEQKMLDSQNTKRALHKDTDALEWSDDLKNLAQKYVDKYDCSGNLAHHDEFIDIGENLAVGYDDVDAVDAWYNEIKYYNFNNAVYQSKTGHFTQMVWKDSKKVGCAYKTCGGDLHNYIVCEYDPAGNWDGEFKDNVKPLK